LPLGGMNRSCGGRRAAQLTRSLLARLGTDGEPDGKQSRGRKNGGVLMSPWVGVSGAGSVLACGRVKGAASQLLQRFRRTTRNKPLALLRCKPAKVFQLY